MTSIRVALLALLVGCGGGSGIKYTLTPVSPAPVVPAEPLDPACDFEVFKEAPQGEFDKLADLTPVDFGATSTDEFKFAVRADVCKVGGEIVVGTVNGAGNFIKATVYRRHRTVVPAPADGTAPAQ
jgi:hypothetical protein